MWALKKPVPEGRHLFLAVCFAVCIGAPAGSAQSPLATSPAKTPAQHVKLGSLDVTVNWRSRVELWNWFEGATGDGDYAFGHSLFRVGLGQKRERADWLVELEQPTILALPADAVAPPPLGQLGI